MGVRELGTESQSTAEQAAVRDTAACDLGQLAEPTTEAANMATPSIGDIRVANRYSVLPSTEDEDDCEGAPPSPSPEMLRRAGRA